jgi:hypothetical protein
MRRLVSLVVSVCSLLGSTVPAAPAAQASYVFGHDYSWPQCPKGVGNGQGAPLPGGIHDFAVVGLTNGTAMHENPCLASQWAYARVHARWVSGYTMATYPTPAQLRAARTGHYGTCTTTGCRLRNAGWAEAGFADASLRGVGAHPALVWVDVEPRRTTRWSSSRSHNSIVIRALLAGLEARGYRVGIYSTASMWHTIAGFRTPLPEWVPASSRTGGCRRSFAGGHVWLAQYTHTHPGGAAYDENIRCGGAPTAAWWWQRSRPRVATDRTPTGALVARFDAGRWFRIGAAPRAPVVGTVSSPAGPVPVFAVVDAQQRLRVRSLATSWLYLPATGCTGDPLVNVAGAVVTVQCTTAAEQILSTSLEVSTLLRSGNVPTG